MIEKASLGAISVGAFVKLHGMATAAMGQADDLAFIALGKLEASSDAEMASWGAWTVVA